VIRDILDYDAWLQGSALGPGIWLEGVRSAFWEVVHATGERPFSMQCERTLFIPTSCRNPRRLGFDSTAITNPLPSSVPPLSPENEKKIICALMKDLNMFFGVGVDPSPSLERGVVTQETDNENTRVVLIGASHMIRLAENMGPETVSLAFHGFRPREPTITELADELQKLGLGNRDTVVLDLLSNSALWALTVTGRQPRSSGLRMAAIMLSAALTVAPISCAKNILSACTPIAEALKNTDVVLLSPVPRYMHTKCCDDPIHVENFDDPDLDKEIEESLEGYKWVLQN
jgi:hypothetical protein